MRFPFLSVNGLQQADVLVVGGGVAGMTVALELAGQGLTSILVEVQPFIGGRVASLGRVFPNMVSGALIVKGMTDEIDRLFREEKMDVRTLALMTSVERTDRGFTVDMSMRPRHVNDRCAKCGECSDACPVIIPDEMEFGSGETKAIRVVRKGWPVRSIVDMRYCTRCGSCIEACARDAIDLEEKGVDETVEVRSIVFANGLEPIDPTQIPEFGYGKHKDIITSLQLERMLSSEGPTQGRLLRPSDGSAPKVMAFIQCVGSRVERRGVRYCSSVCCINAIKNAMLAKEIDPAMDVYVLYIDIRTHGRGYENAYKEARRKGVRFIRGQPSLVLMQDGRPLVSGENTLLKELYDIPADLVVLCIGLRTSEMTKQNMIAAGLSMNSEGLVQVKDEMVRSDQSFVPGVFLAGSVESPKDVKDTVLHARACARSVVAFLKV
jgi:heterodisulfide reductase subunit A